MGENLVLLFSLKGRSLLVGSEVESYWDPMSGQKEDYFTHRVQGVNRKRWGIPSAHRGHLRYYERI